MEFRKDVARRDVTLNKFLTEENITRNELKTHIKNGIIELDDIHDVQELRNWLYDNHHTFNKIKKTVLMILIDEMVNEGVLIKDAPQKGKQSYWYTVR
jgi:hypothetical protein